MREILEPFYPVWRCGILVLGTLMRLWGAME